LIQACGLIADERIRAALRAAAADALGILGDSRGRLEEALTELFL